MNSGKSRCHLSPIQFVTQVSQMEDSHKLLILFGEQRKIIYTQSSDSIGQIYCKVKEVFSIRNNLFVLQRFDNDFDDWVDSDSAYIPCNKERLRVVEVKNSTPTDDLITDNVSVLNNSCDDLFTEEDAVCCYYIYIIPIWVYPNMLRFFPPILKMSVISIYPFLMQDTDDIICSPIKVNTYCFNISELCSIIYTHACTITIYITFVLKGKHSS